VSICKNGCRAALDHPAYVSDNNSALSFFPPQHLCCLAFECPSATPGLSIMNFLLAFSSCVVGGLTLLWVRITAVSAPRSSPRNEERSPGAYLIVNNSRIMDVIVSILSHRMATEDAPMTSRCPPLALFSRAGRQKTHVSQQGQKGRRKCATTNGHNRHEPRISQLKS